MIQAPTPTGRASAHVLARPTGLDQTRPLEASPQVAWRLFGWFGAGLVVVSFADIGLAGYPVRLGDPDWEFGVIHQVSAILPLPTLGLAAVLASAFAQGKRGIVRGVAVLLVVLALTILAMDVVFLTVVPLAVKSVPATILPGVEKAIARTAVAGIVFPAMYLVAAAAAWRCSRPPS